MFVFLVNNLVGQQNETTGSSILSNPNSGYSMGDSAWKLVGLVILCAVILVASYYTTKWVGKNQKKRQSGANFELIDAMRLSPNKTLQLIRTGTRYMVLAVTKDNVTFITELSESDIIFSEAKEAASFKEVLAGIVRKKESDTKKSEIAKYADAFSETEKENVEEKDEECDNSNKGSDES